jgi:cobalt-zinc-cadmium efflux system protein
MGGDHAHGAGHAHSHAPAHFGRAFAIGVALNLIYVAIEAGYGFVAGSSALIADAGHNLSDVLSLALAWGASVLARQAPTGRFTYGYKSSTILAAIANAVLLLVAVAAIGFETVSHMAAPAPVKGGTMMVVAAVGIAVNAFTALLFARGRKDDINVRAAFLHMAADALVSIGVVAAGGLIVLTGAEWIDPAAGLAIVLVIAWGTWGLLKDSFKLGMLGVPEGIDEGAVRRQLAALPGVAAVHDLHIWPMSTTETALTAHLVMPGGHPGDAFLRDLAHDLAHHHGIGHTTVQVELDADCAADC